MASHWKITAYGSAIVFAAAMSPPHALFSQEQEPGVEAGGVYESHTSPGEVGLEVTPVWEGDGLSFRISANTHSVDLAGLQLDELILLEAGGTTWRPTEAGGLGGHHAETTIRFEMPSRPESFVLVIRDVPDVPVRRLAWPAIVETGDSPETGSGT